MIRGNDCPLLVYYFKQIIFTAFHFLPATFLPFHVPAGIFLQPVLKMRESGDLPVFYQGADHI